MPNPFDPPTDLESDLGPPRYEEFAPDEPLLWTAAKTVAEQRQHGCHYAEGACPECLAIAERVLRAIFPEQPPTGALESMAKGAYDSVYRWRSSWDWSTDGAKTTARHQVLAAYRSMPVWRVLWGK